MRHFMVNGRHYREVSLDSDSNDEPPSYYDASLGRIMRALPTPNAERNTVRTRNGNFVQAVAR